MQKQVIWACRVSRTCEITRLNNVIKVSPNILTLTDAHSRGQKVGDSDVATFFHSASRRPIHCSALTAVDTRKLLRARNHFPHGPNRFARHFARRRGIPRTSRCKTKMLLPLYRDGFPMKGSRESSNNIECLPRAIPPGVWRTKKRASDQHGSDKFMAGHMWTCRRSFSYLGFRVRFPASSWVGRPSLEQCSIATNLLQSRGHLRPEQNRRKNRCPPLARASS